MQYASIMKTCCKLIGNSAGSISRTVIDNNDFKVLKRLIFEGPEAFP